MTPLCSLLIANYKANMGCDYYVETRLTIEYKDKSTDNWSRKKYVRLNQERRWWTTSCPKYDSDDPKEVRDAAEAEFQALTLLELDNYHKKMLIYEDGKWITDNQENIKLYVAKIGPENMPEIYKIEKEIFAYRA
jgi:hypothetical protein